MNGSGKGGNNRINRQRFSGRRDDSHTHKQRDNLPSDGKFEKNRTNPQERANWTTPKVSSNPIPTHECPWCGKPISDISTALPDKNTGKPVHFDCVLSRITEMETLENHDYICYIGGGRFGVVHYNNPPDTKNFTIKKILEWENKDNHFEWRQSISEHFALT
jgi:hypothetical protein